MPHISVVIPVYGSKTTLFELYHRLKETLEVINPDFEIILVNDASPDGAWETILEVSKLDQRVTGINLSRNFGQHAAITAGLDHSTGEWVIVMDCDLQDQPEEITKLYRKTSEGYDVILARRVHRKDSFFKRLSSSVFYKVLSYLTGIDYDESIANFGVYNKKVIRAFCQMRENIRVFPIMVKWLGFNRTTVDVAHAARSVGKSSYSVRKLLHLALDIILSYSDKPIRLIIKFGFWVTITSFIFAIVTIIRYFFGEIRVTGYTSLILSIWFLSGLIISILGVVGLYVGKIFESVKNRPIYSVASKTNEA